MLSAAERRNEDRIAFRVPAHVMVGDQRQWVSYDDIEVHSDDFAEIGWDFIKSGRVKIGNVGVGKSQLMNQRELVDFGTDWITRTRK